MGTEQGPINQNEHEKLLQEQFKKEQELKQELMPFVVAMVEKRIKEQGISEEEIRRVTKELKHDSSLKTDENLTGEDLADVNLTDEDLEGLREDAIAAWKEETIDLELGKQVRERD